MSADTWRKQQQGHTVPIRVLDRQLMRVSASHMHALFSQGMFSWQKM
jgi:hypothetical protein